MAARRCIVVGSGLAGLSAAYALVKRRWTVTVFEAQDRLGGRVYTYPFPKTKTLPSMTCELGAEWIGADHKTVRDLCRAFGLPIEHHKYSTQFWMNGKLSRIHKPTSATLKRPAETEYERFLRRFRRMNLVEKKAFDRLDWWTQLKRIGLDPAQLRQRELEDGTDFGESIRMASAFVAATEYAASNDTDELDGKITGGNRRLIDALAAAIGVRRIRSGAVVEGIRQNATEVEVTVRHKGRLTTQRADICICAIPATRLGAIRWHPRPEEHLDAALQLQYSRITKTAIRFDTRFWRRRKRSGFALFTSKVADFCFDSAYREKTTCGILCSYAFGEKAANVATEHKHDLVKWIREDVQNALHLPPKEIPGSVMQKAWHEDKFCGGAYAFYRPGQWFTVRPALQRPYGRVHFAGEHLSEDSGFMEGAVRSGLDAAVAVTN